MGSICIYLISCCHVFICTTVFYWLFQICWSLYLKSLHASRTPNSCGAGLEPSTRLARSRRTRPRRSTWCRKAWRTPPRRSSSRMTHPTPTSGVYPCTRLLTSAPQPSSLPLTFNLPYACRVLIPISHSCVQPEVTVLQSPHNLKSPHY